MSTETPGMWGHNAAGILGPDDPDMVRYQRGKGYAWPPFADRAELWLTGASSITKPIAKDWAFLEGHRAAQFAAENRRELAEIRRKDVALRWIKDGARELAAVPLARGSAFHLHTALLDAGRSSTVEPDNEIDGMMAGWAAFKADHSIIIGGIERTLYAPHLGCAGTADRIAKANNPPAGWAPDDLFVIDIKTTSQDLAKIDLDVTYLGQGTVLSSARYIAFEETRTVKDLWDGFFAGFVIVWVHPKGGYRAQWVRIEELPTVQTLVQTLATVKSLHNSISAGAFGTTSYRHPDTLADQTTHTPGLLATTGKES